VVQGKASIATHKGKCWNREEGKGETGKDKNGEDSHMTAIDVLRYSVAGGWRGVN